MSSLSRKELDGAILQICASLTVKQLGALFQIVHTINSSHISEWKISEILNHKEEVGRFTNDVSL